MQKITDGKLRLLFLADAGAVHAQRWIDYFRQRGHDTRWLSLEGIPPGIEATKLPERFIHRAGSLLLAIPRIRSEIKRFRPHLLNALFIPNYGWIGGLIGFSPLVVAAWGSDVLLSPLKSALHRRRVAWTIKQADLLFADARIITERMIELGADARKIVTVPLGVEPDLLSMSLGKRGSEGRCTVISARKFEPLYRNETFVEAAISLVGSEPVNYNFVMIGEGSTRLELEDRVRNSQANGALIFYPFLATAKLREQLVLAEIYVSCSVSDGTSVSLLEAMALGLQPIVTDIPANREWIVDGVNGRLFPVGDATALARIIGEVRSSKADWPAVQKKNREIITTRALWPDNMAIVEQAMINLFDQSKCT